MDGVIIAWVVFFSFIGPIYIVACVFSVFKAIEDRKSIQKRNRQRARARSSKRMPKIEIIEDVERSEKYRNQTFSNSNKLKANGSESGSIIDSDVGSVRSYQGNGIGTGRVHRSSHEGGHDASSPSRRVGDGSTNPADSRLKSGAGDKDRQRRGKKPKPGNSNKMEVTVEKNLQAPPVTVNSSGQTGVGVDVPHSCRDEPYLTDDVYQNARHSLDNTVREANGHLEGGDGQLPNSTHVEMERFSNENDENRRAMSSPLDVRSQRAEHIKTTDLDATSDSERFASDQDKSPETPRRRGRGVARQSADQPQLHHLSRPKPPRQGKAGRGGHVSHTNNVTDGGPEKRSASPSLENTCADGIKVLVSSKSEKELADPLITHSSRRSSYCTPGQEQWGWMDSPSPVLRTRSEDNLKTDRMHFLSDNPSPSDGGTVNRAFVRSNELPFH